MKQEQTTSWLNFRILYCTGVTLDCFAVHNLLEVLLWELASPEEGSSWEQDSAWPGTYVKILGRRG